MSTQTFQVGFLVFPGLTQLDMTGPYEVLNRMPGCEVVLVWKSTDPVRTEHGLTISPVVDFAGCPPLDLLCIPGGFGVNALLDDQAVLDFVREHAERARYVTSVCTGSLVLGVAGLFVGRRATSHWMSREYLKAFGATPVDERVVVDGKLITGGGVTAGIDFGLTVVAEVAGEGIAREIQLAIEYDPAPPFESGSPRSAANSLVNGLKEKWGPKQEERRALVMQAAQALD
ncbi:MAG: DJ-1/PfpI family protein [Gammaproteobacteria bacterium]